MCDAESQRTEDLHDAIYDRILQQQFQQYLAILFGNVFPWNLCTAACERFEKIARVVIWIPDVLHAFCMFCMRMFSFEIRIHFNVFGAMLEFVVLHDERFMFLADIKQKGTVEIQRCCKLTLRRFP